MQVTIVNSCPDSVQVIYWNGELQVNAFLRKIVRDCFLSYLNEEDKSKLTHRGEVRTYSEQFKWLPTDDANDAIPAWVLSDVKGFASAIGNGGAL